MPHSIKITGIAPADVLAAPEPLRRQYWQIVVPIALKVKDKELAEGLDAHGDPLKPISAKTRKYRRSAMTPTGKGSPSAPPLMPAYQKSRVRSLLAGRAFASHAELYWRYDPFTGASFDVILNYQREMGRDVFGISPDGMRQIQQQASVEWTKWKKSGLAPTVKKAAFPSAALSAGPQPRIVRIVHESALPNAAAKTTVGVGNMSTRWMTRGAQAPTVKALKALPRTGSMTWEDWRRYYTQEEGTPGKPPSRGVVWWKPITPRTPTLARLVRVLRETIGL